MINDLGLLLDQVVPKRMNLWFDSNPSPSRVQPALEDLAKRSVEVDLYTSSRSGEGASYLKALTGPGSLCKVTSCQGFVSASTAELLPTSVTSLTISTDFQSLPALAAALARLEDLDWFCEVSEPLTRQLHDRGVWVEDLYVNCSSSDAAIDRDRQHDLALDLGVPPVWLSSELE
ncbi:uncharacterized protein LOC125033483 isoform X2 [Penaeus chinensis]|uniref:uncharacterized protein LOC125033483 isoform X2 n=1 Tax=Penaeus chinensis TaxID=139456 RepID=UPI001FB666C8|nr:uncharacterized protein LOC125033483 isoform X2 [Penaeus chinensis]